MLHCISFSGDEAGMHIILTVHKDTTEKGLEELASNSKIRVYGMNEYRTNPVAGEPSFLIGFGGLSSTDIQQAVNNLMEAWHIKKGEDSN